MTKKDYEAIARIINCVYDNTSLSDYARGVRATQHVIANQLSDVMQADNPRFDRVRFLKACGVQS